MALPEVQRTEPRRGWRTWVSAPLLVLAVVLSPLAVAAPWAHATITDTDTFVATFAPLAHEEPMTDFIVDRSMQAIESRVDFDDLAASAVNGLTSLGTGDRTTQLLELTVAPLASTLRNSVRDGIDSFVTSDQFPAVWEQVLRQSHAQVVGVLSGRNAGVVTASSAGDLTLNFGPIIDAVRTRLAAQGVAVATLLPAINPTVVIAQSDAIPAAQVLLNLLTLAGYWLPLVVVGLLIVGILLAHGRAKATIRVAIGVLAAMAICAVLFDGAGIAMPSIAASAGLPVSVATLLFDDATAELRRLVAVIALLAGLTAVMTWILGPFTMPRKLRDTVATSLQRARSRAEKAGVTTGRFGEQLYRFRYAAFAAIGAGCVLTLAFARPLSVSTVVWTVVVSTVLALLVLVTQRPQSGR